MKTNLKESIQEHAISFEDELPTQQILDAVGDAQIVLLGESTHGTSEYYSARAQLSKKLIEEKGFTVIAVEADWPAAFNINQYIKAYPGAAASTKDVLKAFNRWPEWMWANKEVSELIDWLKAYNLQKQSNSKVGFYGFDIYSLPESIEEVEKNLEDLGEHDSDLMQAKRVSSCFENFQPLPDHYALATFHFDKNCAEEAATLSAAIKQHEHLYPLEFEQSLNIRMNALIVQNAEQYYRTAAKSDSLSWNIRDEHMVVTIQELKRFHGQNTKVIVWAHNTHVGDASATAMKDAGMVNVGQIARAHYGRENVYAIGFGTYEGSVIAGEKWGVPFKTMDIPPARHGAWEHYLHNAGGQNQLLLFDETNRHKFSKMIDHRAIGVVYEPEYEMYGNYVPSQIGNRYDAFIFFDKTSALHPLSTE